MHKILLSICLTSVLLLLQGNPAHAIVIEVTPSFQEVDVNSSVTVDLVISDLGDGIDPSVGAYDLDIQYAPSVLSFPGMSGVTFGDQLDIFGLGSIQSVDYSVPGVINLYEVSLDFPEDLNDLQLPGFTLATLTFDAIGVGPSILDITLNALGDAYGVPLAADLVGAEIMVNRVEQIPEPGILLLLAAGIAGVSWRRPAR
jgi:hypothetical protein